MTPTLARRLLALPADVRAALAAVPGPGWICVRRVDGFVLPVLRIGTPRRLKSHEAWWPANPADALRSVLGYDTLQAYERITNWILTRGSDDHEAAVAIIEWSLS